MTPTPSTNSLVEALQQRWRGKAQFVVLEGAFDLGLRFLQTWAAWRNDPQRPQRLFFLSQQEQLPASAELLQAHAAGSLAPLAAQLAEHWPPSVRGWHRLDFEGQALQLLVAVGPAQESLSQWQAQVDAFLLNDPAPKLEDLQPLSRLAAAGSLLFSAHDGLPLRSTLRQAGFEWRETGSQAATAFALRHIPRSPAGRQPLAPEAREAIVLGAGLAGAACARALHAAGLEVRVFDAAPQAASQASGNPAGLFHGTLHLDDGPHARWNRSAALRTRQWLGLYPPLWCVDGLLRLSPGEALSTRQQLALAQQLDPAFAEPLDATGATTRAGMALQDGAWLYPGGGALSPRDWVLRLLEGLPLQTETQVAAVQPLPGGRWQLLDRQGQALAETALLVLAAGQHLPALLAPLDEDLAAWLQPQRGQLSWWLSAANGPRLPIASGGYVLQAPQGPALVAGASADLHDDDPQLRDADQSRNHAVAERLLGRALPAPDGGRVGWRLLAPDKLPLVGGLIDPAQAQPHRATQVSAWARRPGLLVCGAMASRGISWAALAAELLVAQALGWPVPVPRNLQDALDPARLQVRKLRQGSSGQSSRPVSPS
jgi:tRNA 5-methylaminomethyl-2-thiouridine biosynthesis bifunctional protein